jgi:hypothetical protein
VVIHLPTVGFNSKEKDMTTETPKPVHPTVTPTAPVTTPTAKVVPKVTPTTHKEGVDKAVHTPVSPNIIQPSPTPETLVSEPGPGHPPRQAGTQGEAARKDARARGYSIGPNEPPATIRVKNLHTIALNLEAGIIQPGDTGLATDAEVSNLSGQYLEVV